MKIKTYQVIELEYTLRIEGAIVERTPEGTTKHILTHFASDLPKGLEAALMGKAVGEYRVHIAPEQAYGLYNPKLRITAKTTDLPEEPRIGGGFAAEDDLLYRVIEIVGDQVVLDANHEWAGKELEYHFKIHTLRPAEKGEIEHGHVHGLGGVQH
jgi:FKBP-type peptidyl-prolyl cis-trans isomerase SlyD